MVEWPIDESRSGDLFRKINTLIRIVFHEDPDSMDDDTYSMRWNELQWAAKSGFLPFEFT